MRRLTRAAIGATAAMIDRLNLATQKRVHELGGHRVSCSGLSGFVSRQVDRPLHGTHVICVNICMNYI